MVTTRRGASTGPPSETAMKPSPSPSPSSASSSTATATATATRTPPFLPTPLERLAFVVFPALLAFGTLYSQVNPQTRASTYDALAQAYVQDSNGSPNYFARKSNIFNVIFVKRGWGWNSLAFAVFLFTHPSTGPVGALTPQRIRACLRWGIVTAWWFAITQWCFGPPLIDRGFRWTGGQCGAAEVDIAWGVEKLGTLATAAACRAAGGRWQGGHDISGHVFLLVLGTVFLLQEVGWPLARWTGWNRDERCIQMTDGAVKGASVESSSVVGVDAHAGEEGALGFGGRFVAVVGGLNLWMLLMTAIYFHTWFEKVRLRLHLSEEAVLEGYHAVLTRTIAHRADSSDCGSVHGLLCSSFAAWLATGYRTTRYIEDGETKMRTNPKKIIPKLPDNGSSLPNRVGLFYFDV